MPLFLTQLGNFAEKRHVVESLELVALRVGEPLTDVHGSRRFGGHSLRVTGTRTLASMGIDVLLIQLMARWSSDVVLRYVSEAPLAAITDVFRGRARTGANRLQHLGDDPADLADQRRAAKASPVADPRTVGYLAEELSLAAAKAERGAALPAQELMLNTSSGVLHRPLVWSRTVPPHSWRTECGWPFGAAALPGALHRTLLARTAVGLASDLQPRHQPRAFRARRPLRLPPRPPGRPVALLGRGGVKSGASALDLASPPSSSKTAALRVGGGPCR